MNDTNTETVRAVETFIPLFPGFYVSLYDAHIDSEVELLVENYADDYPHIDRNELFDVIHSSIDYATAITRIAQLHARVFVEYLTEVVRELPGFERQSVPAWQFVRVVSPREYNFENDRVLIRVEESFIQRLFEARDEDVFAEAVRRRHSSYGGFISFYTDNAQDPEWQDVDNFDDHQIETLLLSIIEQVTDPSDFSEEVINEVVDEATGRGLVEDCLNYDAVEAKLGAINGQTA